MYKFNPKLYLTRVPDIASYSSQELKMFGSPGVFENGKYKKEALLANMTTVMINIETMIQYYSNGYPLSVVNPNDVKEIHEELEMYLRDTNPIYSNSLHKVKRDELLLDEIDKFAEEMFSLNRNTIVGGIISARDNAFSIGFTPFQVQRPIQPTVETYERSTSVLSAYGGVEVSQPTTEMSNNTYLTEFAPEIDISSVRRTPIPRGVILRDD